jgi:polysaccharide biosynthesis protein PslH
MRILFLTQIIPWPVDAGPKVKTWNVLRYLHSQGHEIHLASFVRAEEEKHLEKLRTVCKEVYAVPIRRSRIADGFYYLRSQLSRRPFLIERDDIEGMRLLIRQLLQDQQFDVFHADQLSMAQFAFESPYPPEDHFALPSCVGNKKPIKVFDAHNAVWTIVERMQQNAPRLLRPLLALEKNRILQYEGAIIRYFDHTFAVTEPDAAALREAAAIADDGKSSLQKLSVIPIAVDADGFPPAKLNSKAQKILTLGTLHYPPNADGIRWFTGEVFPLIRAQIPDAELVIIGKNPPKDIQRFAEESPEAIKVTGYVHDLDPYFDEAAIVVIPVRAGGGMRVRILEAFARAMPVVTTTVGLEGIEAESGYHVLVEDTPEQFADAAVRLLMDEQLKRSLAENGRRLVEQKYDYRVVLGALGRVYEADQGTRAEEAVSSITALA